MYDQITTCGKSIVQHGKSNNRIYLMKSCRGDLPELLETLGRLAKTNHYTKIFAKIPSNQLSVFKSNGYREEASIPLYFTKAEDVHFMAKYLDDNRSRIPKEEKDKIDGIMKKAESKIRSNPDILQNPAFDLRKLKTSDIPALVNVYKIIFASYPFPIHNADYLQKTMQTHINYFGAFINGKLAAASSAEKDEDAKAVEMTDFATLPEYRGKKMALYLLKTMENHAHGENYKICYTIARALSPGMNITFAKNGYVFGGTLINNTQISGKIESMNVWYKQI